MTHIEFRPIGIIHTPFTESDGVPRQPHRGKGIQGTIEIFPRYAEGLADLDGFSHIYVIFHLHRSTEFKLKVTPPNSDRERGLFASRSPNRPNPIGLSIVRVRRIEKTTLYIEDIDMIDGTPVLDIKPFTGRHEEPDDSRIGWLKNRTDRADGSEADDAIES